MRSLLPLGGFVRALTQALPLALLCLGGTVAPTQATGLTLSQVLQTRDIVVLADVRHGVRERIALFSSVALFEAMQRAGVRHVAIEMPRVLGRQAMGVETVEDIEAFAQDVVRAGHWHFTDPDNPKAALSATQYRVARALGQQVFLAKQFGINPIFYDFNNPLGNFTTHNDPVYRCLAALSQPTFRKYGLRGEVTKAQRDAAIMRERFSHDDELAAYIEREVRARGGGKLVIIPGYAHAVMPGGLADRIEQRLQTPATVVAILKDEVEGNAFHSQLWEQSRLLAIDLSRPPNFYYSIASGTLRADDAPGRYIALDGSTRRDSPSICLQLARLH